MTENCSSTPDPPWVLLPLKFSNTYIGVCRYVHHYYCLGATQIGGCGRLHGAHTMIRCQECYAAVVMALDLEASDEDR